MSANVREAVVQPQLVAKRPRWGEAAARVFVAVAGAFVVITTLLLLAFLAETGVRGFAEVGIGQLLFHDIWKPEAGLYGGLPLVLGTLVSATGAVLVGAAPAVLSAVWLTEFAPKTWRDLYRRLFEIGAAVPSVVYGWLALVYLVPAVGGLAEKAYPEGASVGGEGLASAAMLLGIMIAPTVFLLSLDALSRVPNNLRDASAALGASPWQTAFRVVMPGAWRGLLVAVFFGFSRAAGETMAVQMVIGGARRIPENMFSPTTTISAQIVMDMQNARPNTPESDVLFAMSLVLLVISTGVVLAIRALSARKAV
jgi:phosphate transport system permease protein